jgi:adenylylsulfate kinase
MRGVAEQAVTEKTGSAAAWREPGYRSLVKSVSYRIFASMGTAGIVYVLSGDLKLSLGAGALDTVVKLALYFIHERIWSRIPLGR